MPPRQTAFFRVMVGGLGDPRERRAKDRVAQRDRPGPDLRGVGERSSGAAWSPGMTFPRIWRNTLSSFTAAPACSTVVKCCTGYWPASGGAFPSPTTAWRSPIFTGSCRAPLSLSACRQVRKYAAPQARLNDATAPGVSSLLAGRKRDRRATIRACFLKALPTE